MVFRTQSRQIRGGTLNMKQLHFRIYSSNIPSLVMAIVSTFIASSFSKKFVLICSPVTLPTYSITNGNFEVFI